MFKKPKLLGKAKIREDKKMSGHYLYLGSNGWCDCTVLEDQFINNWRAHNPPPLTPREK